MFVAVLPEKFILQSGQEKHSFHLYCTISERTNTLGFVDAGNTDDLKYMKAAGDW